MRIGRELLGVVLLAMLAACNSAYRAPVDQAGEPLYLNAGRQHLVNQGETLYAVAWMYDLDPNALARVNNLREPYTLTPGQRLTVDLRGQSAAPAAATTRAAGATGTTAVTAVNPVRSSGTISRSTLPPSERPARSALPSTGGAAAPAATAPAPAATVPAAPATTTPRTAATAPAPASPPPAVAATAVTPADSLAPAVLNNGEVSWAWPYRGTIVGRFSESGADNKGIDIAGNEGDAVLAAADGEVVYAGSGLLRYGNLLIIKHNDRYLSAYAHNRALLVAEKAKVTKGQKIAELGKSGIDRNMLHFEIRVDGKPSDPLQYLPAL